MITAAIANSIRCMQGDGLEIDSNQDLLSPRWFAGLVVRALESKGPVLLMLQPRVVTAAATFYRVVGMMPLVVRRLGCG